MCKALCGRDILRLRALVTCRKQDHELAAASGEVDAVPRPIVDAHFVDALSNGFSIAGIAKGQPTDAGIDPRRA